MKWKEKFGWKNGSKFEKHSASVTRYAMSKQAIIWLAKILIFNHTAANEKLPSNYLTSSQ